MLIQKVHIENNIHGYFNIMWNYMQCYGIYYYALK